MRTFRARWVMLAALVASASSLDAQGLHVLVVDENNGPGTDFTVLQDAIDAAVEGDLLLIRAGFYDCTISGKSLVLQAETLDTVKLTDLKISGLGAPQSVLVRGCDTCCYPAPLVMDCAGTVRIEQGVFYGINCVRARDLVLRHMEVRGRIDYVYGCQGGIDAVDSSLYVYNSIVYGAKAFNIGMGAAACYGRPGIVLTNSSLYLHGSFVSGSDEESSHQAGFPPICPTSGLVSDGLQPVEITGGGIKAGKVRTSACTTLPPAIVGITPAHRAGTARRIDSSSPLLEGQASKVSYSGDPGDVVYLAMSTVPAAARYFPFAGFYHALIGATTIVPVGVLPASGTLEQSFVVPTYAGPEVVHSLFLQPFFVSPSGEHQLGTPTQVHVLDPAY